MHLTAAPIATAPRTAPTSSPTPPAEQGPGTPEHMPGIHGKVADAIRAAATGYATVTKQTAIQAEKAAIHPFETVSTATGLIKEKTAGIKYVNKATGLLHTIGGFGMLIMSSNVSGGLKAPGDTARDLGLRLADAIDGNKSAGGWSLGWGVVADPETGESAVAQSALGEALANMGVK